MSGRGRSAAEEELQHAITARTARQQAAEYSDDFESDDDGMLNSPVEELPESNSDIESTKKSTAFESSLSDEDTSQKAVLLENEAADDLPFHEEKAQETIILENKNMQDDKKDSEEECLESQNGDGDRKNDEDCSPAEVPQENSESGHCNDLCMSELQREVLALNQEKNKPIPKQRMRKMRNAFASDVQACKSLDFGAMSMERDFLNPPFKEGFLEIIHGSQKENCWSGLLDTFSLLSESYYRDQRENISINKEDNATESPSVVDKTKTPGYEKTRKPEKSTDDSSERHMQILEEQIVTDTIQEDDGILMDDKSEHVEIQSETNKTLPQNMKTSSDRSLYFSHLKKNMTALPSSRVVSPQYLGTLKVLEGKRLQKCSAEVGKADSIRAAVYQDWLEKKRVHLLELKRNKKKQAEDLKNNIEKKEAAKREEAIASFEAWKAMKERAAKKLIEKRKLEELNKRRVAEQDEEKREAAQKAFEKWKERKVEYLRDLHRKEKQSERIRKKKEEELIAEKKRDIMSAVEKWNEKKEECIKQKKVEKILERRKQEMQQVKKEEQDKRAMEEYEKWLEKKERKEQLEKKQRKLKAILADKAPSPWSPPGKVTYSRN